MTAWSCWPFFCLLNQFVGMPDFKCVAYKLGSTWNISLCSAAQVSHLTRQEIKHKTVLVTYELKAQLQQTSTTLSKCETSKLHWHTTPIECYMKLCTLPITFTYRNRYTLIRFCDLETERQYREFIQWFLLIMRTRTWSVKFLYKFELNYPANYALS